MSDAQKLNLHVYPSPIVNESRIMRQTSAVAESGLFDAIEICGTHATGLPEEQRLDATRLIRRVGAPTERPRSVLHRVFGQIRWSIAAYRAYARRPLSVVNAHSVAVLPVCWLLARKTDARLIYDTHELETQTSTSHGVQGALFRLIERLLIRRTDAVFVVNDEIAQWYDAAYPGITATSIVNSPSQSENGRAHDLRAAADIPPEARLYVHVGNLAHARSIPDLLAVFTQRTHDHLVFLGAGPLEDVVKDAAASRSNIHWHPPVDSANVVPTLRSADVGICTIEPTCLSYQLSLPNKAIEYTAAGVPFIFNDLPAVRRLLPAELESFQINTVSTDLPALMDKIDENTLARAREALTLAEIPRWDTESARMIAKYEELLDGPAREQANDDRSMDA